MVPFKGHMGIMEKKMETTGYRIMEKKVETTIMGYILGLLHIGIFYPEPLRSSYRAQVKSPQIGLA